MSPKPGWPTRCPSCGKDGANEVCSNAWHYMPTEPPSQKHVERAKAIARERGWLVGEEWAWDKQR